MDLGVEVLVAGIHDPTSKDGHAVPMLGPVASGHQRRISLNAEDSAVVMAQPSGREK